MFTNRITFGDCSQWAKLVAKKGSSAGPRLKEEDLVAIEARAGSKLKAEFVRLLIDSTTCHRKTGRLSLNDLVSAIDDCAWQERLRVTRGKLVRGPLTYDNDHFGTAYDAAQLLSAKLKFREMEILLSALKICYWSNNMEKFALHFPHALVSTGAIMARKDRRPYYYAPESVREAYALGLLSVTPSSG